ncbi:hypothetical protein DNU06_08610 [Putridiphycobacter roseus]|uniref:Undecaprenyl/decaprenyl-phosphate alpha-N-acetylglucosaminyl 1-phosphate transferase n=1 Tax=Putridiphycobacter roseus TaxID=2219161 RepID=A0A2W1NNV7_9FLAO|nr:MraY family glycosyltransferase [Putridiphycobacter roseus]PZE17322.1 hypothetical protein DNU06_08610 [Putridiphycobacter roseus]
MRESLLSIFNIIIITGGAFVLSFLINHFFLRFSKSFGIRNKNDVTIRWSNTSRPSLGGISFYIVFLMSFMFYAIFIGDDNIFKNQELLGLFYTATLAFLLGLSDDAYDTRPFIKLFIQISCAVILIFTNNGVMLFDMPILNYIITLLWVVGIMNSINMLDNMDGITTIISICIVVLFVFINTPFSIENNIDIFFLMTTLGALLGFLFFNYPPAKMFMGDTGSQFIGIILAYFSIKYLWNDGVETQTQGVFANVSIVLIAFSVPLIDTFTVSINRLLKKKSPMVGGKDHTTHHLVYKGFTEKQVFYVFMFLGLIASILGFVFQRYIPYYSLSYIILWGYFGLLLTFFIRMTRKQKHLEKNA